MNAIDADLQGFDFTWSSCCFEHLGCIGGRHAVRLNSVERCLRPGGVAVHTAELNLSSDDATIATGLPWLYRRRDMLALNMLRGAGTKYIRSCRLRTRTIWSPMLTCRRTRTILTSSWKLPRRRPPLLASLSTRPSLKRRKRVTAHAPIRCLSLCRFLRALVQGSGIESHDPADLCAALRCTGRVRESQVLGVVCYRAGAGRALHAADRHARTRLRRRDEPLSSFFAGRGCCILATDLHSEMSGESWIATDQHAASKEQLFQPLLVQRDIFDARVSFDRPACGHSTVYLPGVATSCGVRAPLNISAPSCGLRLRHSLGSVAQAWRGRGAYDRVQRAIRRRNGGSRRRRDLSSPRHS